MKKSLSLFLAFVFCTLLSHAQQPNIIYVTPTGTGTGTQASPAGLTYAVANAGPGKQIRLAAGTYTLSNTFNMTGNLTLEGGYDPVTWCKNSSLRSKIIRDNQNITANPNRLVAIACTNISNFYIFDLDIETANAVGNGVSTYGIYLNGCSDYSIARCKIKAGNGSDGTPGINGTNGVNGAAGVNGGNGCDNCGNTASRQGGAGGGGSYPGSFGGGTGGAGGARSTGCPGSTNGSAGTAGQGPGGAGGNGGQSTCSFISLPGTCDGNGPAAQGQPGVAGANGTNGADGVQGVSGYSIGFFQPAIGSNGQNGQNGRGGGGGGGGGSQSGMPNIPFIGNRNDDGPGGAGGGEGGQGGIGATGGGGGGGSFGVFIWNNGANSRLVDSDIQSGLPGNGAQGGQSGGNGGNGGNGGPGMNRSTCDMGFGGPGGRGGNGGNGGVGGNGGPGESLIIYEDPNGQPINQASFASPVEPQISVCGYGCTLSEFTFTTNAFGFIQWFFDGGSVPLVATGSTVNVHFTSMGRHTVTLVVNGLPYIFNEFVGVFENGAPYVPDIVTTDTSICPGGTVNVGSSYAGLNYDWQFDNGAPATQTGAQFGNTSAVFTAEGDHQIRLRSESQSCGWSVYDSLTVHVLPVLAPEVLVSSSGARICNGGDVTFGASAVNGGNNPQFAWYVNGAPTGVTGPVFTQTGLTGPITVTAEMTSNYVCAQPTTVTSLPVNITVNPQPTMTCQFLGNYLGAPSTFTALPAGGTAPYTFLWNFGDGGISSDSVATHRFSGTGNYAVTVTAIDANGCKADCSIPMTIVVAPQVNADFSFSLQTRCGSTQVQFSDSSTGNVVAWFWNFGDGSPTSTLQNPTHTYTAAGTYTVMLVASNGVNFDTTYAPNAVTVEALPTAGIGAVSRTGCEPYPVQFQDASSGATSWNWDFGDGSPASTLQNPAHTYLTAGSYTVTLRVGNNISGCADTSTEVNYIVINPSPVAAFVGAPLEVCTGRSVQFTDQSTGGVTQWLWHFGDGNTSTAQNPSYVYTYPGTYAVWLEVTGLGPTHCTDIESKGQYVKVHQTPEASFTVNPVKIQLPYNVANFTNTSYGYDFVKWDFGNGATSTEINPYTQYPDSGVYRVTLYAAVNFGCADSAMQVIEVLEQMSIFMPNAFTPDGDILNENLVVATKGLKKFKLTIFDRWGGAIFSTTDPDYRWDGKTREGKPYPVGLYAYVINYQYYVGPEQTQKGSVYLVK